MIIAELETDGWELLSAVEQHERSPAFEIPPIESRLNLAAGTQVRLFFCLLRVDTRKPTIELEGMWVTITERYNYIYHGVLDSTPGVPCVLKAGDDIFFTPDHICSVLVPDSDPRID